MGLFSALTQRRSVSYQDVWGAGGNWDALVSKYTPMDALRLSVVVACVNLRANTISQLPWDVYQLRDGRLDRLPVNPSIIESPSTLPRSQWLRQMSISRDLWGNAFGLLDGVGCEWLDPSEVKVGSDVWGAPLEIRYRGQPVNVASLLIVPGMPVPGKRCGITPLEQSGLVDLASITQDFGRDWFRNGAVPSGIVKADRELTEEQADALRDRIAAAWRARKPAVIGSGLSYESNPIKADESQFLATLRHIQLDICQVFGVPPEKFGTSAQGSSVTYSTRESQAQGFLVDTMNADLVLIQEVMSTLVPRFQFVRANTGALLRSDLSSRYQAYSTAISAGFMTVDEVRGLEDLPPLPEPAPSDVDMLEVSA